MAKGSSMSQSAADVTAADLTSDAEGSQSGRPRSSVPQRRGSQTGKNLLVSITSLLPFHSRFLGRKEDEVASQAAAQKQGDTVDVDISGSSTKSTKSSVSLADTVVHAATSVERDPAREHTFASEQGGQSFLEFIEAFKSDAADQVEYLKIAIERVTATLAYSQKNPRPVSRSDAIVYSEYLEALSAFEGPALCCTAERYIKRIMKYGGSSPCNVIIGLMFLHRIQGAFPLLDLTPKNAQRLLLTAIMVACKVYDDIYYSNKYWGLIGELSASEMRLLEIKCVTF